MLIKNPKNRSIIYKPSFMRFFLPSVPILSQKVSSLSSFFGVTGLPEGDFGCGDAMTDIVGELLALFF